MFGSTLLASAFLLFVVEPMFGKMVLPLVGGSPAVWNTCLLFFQGMLLLGYLYAHFGPRVLGWRPHAIFHLAALGLSVMALPIAIARAESPPVSNNPVPWLLMVLLASLGAPFLLLASTGPLLQAWFVRSEHRDAPNPYFLYSASNAGSLMGLLSYPFLVEPSLPLSRQAVIWSRGYLLLLVLIAGCSVVLWRRPETGPGKDSSAQTSVSSWSARLRWVALAFFPSSLLLGLTTYITMDLAAVPLLWVIPLALYLATFVLVFARTPIVRHEAVLRWQPIFAIALVVLLFWGRYLASPALVPLHLAAFFLTAMACHGEMARARPPTDRLTEYYFWISLGGLLGGVFNVLVAPSVFRSVLEYPLVLALCCALLPGVGLDRKTTVRSAIGAAAITVTVLVAARQALVHFDRPLAQLPLPVILVAAVASCIAAVLSRRQRGTPSHLAFVLGMSVLASEAVEASSSHILLRRRDFFGSHLVREDDARRLHILVHGTTDHGAQSTDPSRRSDPLSYYARSGPLGDVFREIPTGAGRGVAIVGLGAGATAAYGVSGERWTFFEIDPLVERIATDPRYFTYLRDAQASVGVVQGDGRLSLTRAPNAGFRLIILDAFSSDAIPVHLLTREALALYFRKLSQDGALVFHVSNRFLDLEPVLAQLATELGAVGRIRRFSPDASLRARGVDPSVWAVVARDTDALGGLISDQRWRPLTQRPGVGLWTDDFSNIFQVLTIR